jgi:hypothetical protein
MQMLSRYEAVSSGCSSRHIQQNSAKRLLQSQQKGYYAYKSKDTLYYNRIRNILASDISWGIM